MPDALAREWQATFDAIPDAVWLLAPDATIRRCNRASAELFGRAPGAMLGRPCWSIVHGTTQPIPECPVARMRVSRHRESMELQTNGRWFLVTVDPIYDQGGTLAGIVHIVSDITARREAEAERLRLESRVQQTQKMESLAVLAGGVAHDFNNLLMAVMGNAELAREELAPDSPARPLLAEIEKAARRTSDLCRQMLAFSGKGRLAVAPLDLSATVAGMREMLTAAVPRKVALRCELDRPMPLIDADEAQVQQTVVSLVRNAAEAIGDREGTITLRASRMTQAPPLSNAAGEHDFLAAGPCVCLEVTDTGCGMDADTLERVYDPFFSTKFPGRGLGLPAVLGVVRAHKGRIGIRSAPGAGTTVVVLLPAPEPVTDAAQRASADYSAPRDDGGLVLLVDDEAHVRDVCGRMLRRLGYTVVAAVDGPDAIDRLRSVKDTVRLVLLDLTMPRMDGIETFRALRALAPEVRVIMSSGYNPEDVSQRLPDAGLAGVIQKPYQLGTLAAVLRQALAR